MPSTAPDAEAQRGRPIRRRLRFTIPTARNNRRHRANEGHKRKVTEYGDTSATYWNLYMSEAEINDEDLVDSFVNDTNLMLIVNSLFSAIFASFVLEMYKTLRGNVQEPSFKPSNIAIRMNIVMFLSLFFSMMSVVVSALIQQWCREFKTYAYPRAPPHTRGRVRTYLFQGLNQFRIKSVMYGVHVLLHVSVFLFFWALSDFLHTVYEPVGTVARCSFFISLVVYTAFSVSPLIFINSPYHTPLTPPLRSGGIFIFLTFRFLWRFVPGCRGLHCSLLRYFKGIRFDRIHFLADKANSQAGKLDGYAMQWLFTEYHLSDISMDSFLEALPAYITSPLTDQGHLDEQLTTRYILQRLKEHFLTCATSYGLSDETCIARVSACANSLRLLLRSHRFRLHNERTQKDYIQSLMNDLNSLCNGEDQRVALRASCVRGLAFQSFLSHLTPPDVQITPDLPFPILLEPLYSFVCDGDDRDGISPSDSSGSLCTEVRTNPRGDKEKIWEVLLHDGPLVNLTLLSKAVLLHEHVQAPSLSLCWKTLDTLLKEFEIARMKVSESALQRFNRVFKEAHEYIQVEHQGFRVTPLLEILDSVARGRRLSRVFLGHPKYYGRADVVFGKEQLRNSDLMEAFASCLPGYIAETTQEDRREFMEGMVCDDGLWTSLQVNLWNAERLERPIPDKLRIFEACCIVLDVMFLALEDSNKVDWRAPEFASLTQHFELFITNTFQGKFMGRATNFSVGLIRLRFCDVLLTQLHEDLGRERVVSLRSQWDLASLARVFYSLEVGNEEDMISWKSVIDGGHIEAGSMAKVSGMLDIAIRDGPLLNFCKLCHLALMAVPFAGSGLGRADIDKVQAFQEALLGDQDLPLNHASSEVWDELNRLQREVCDVLMGSFDEEKDTLERLLGMIESANNLRPSSQAFHPSPSERSAQTLTNEHEAGPHGPPSSQPVAHNCITSRVVNQIDIVPSYHGSAPGMLPSVRQSVFHE